MFPSNETDKRLTLNDIKPYLRNIKQRGGQIISSCPLCENSDPHGHHLYIKNDNNVLLLYCQKCNANGEEIIRAFREMGAKHIVNEISVEKTLIEDYNHEYRNPDGTLAYCKRRRKWSDGSKQFSFFYVDKNGKTVYTKPDNCNALYNLDLMVKALEQETIPRLWIVEGEKCADAMLEAGLLATTSNTGSQKRIKFSEIDLAILNQFPDKVVITDNDEKGIEFAEAWEDVNVLPITDIWENAPRKSDIADYLEKGFPLDPLINFKVYKIDTTGVAELTAEEILSDDFFNSICSIKDELERKRALAVAGQRASELKLKRAFDSMFKTYLMQFAKRKINHGNIMALDNNTKPPLNGLYCGDWVVDMTGVYKPVQTEEGEYQLERISAMPIVPTAILRNLEYGTEKIALAFFRDETWTTINVPRSLVSNNAKIIDLSDLGVDVNSGTAKDLVKYLSVVINSNDNSKLPRVTTVSHLGWVGENFIPYCENIKTDCGAEFTNTLNAIEHSKGDLDEWIKTVSVLRENMAMRMIINASLASPLVSQVNALPFMLHLWGGTGSGKAQPLNTKIVTPSGYKLMKDVKIGDNVIGGDGKAHKVTGVYPQGIKDVFEITFADGRKTKCCKEHLWNVTTQTRRNKGRGYITLELQEMLKRPIKDAKGYQYQIPLCNPVDFEQDNKLPIPPYLLGALIGDGCLTLKKNPANYNTTIYFSNTENDVIENVCRELHKYNSDLRFNKHTQCEYVVTNAKWLKDAIKSLNLNVRSTERFIPKMYMFADVENRKQLLRGLFDTDGCVSGGRISYSTCSERLANDVQSLAHSLGYRASVSVTIREQHNHNEYKVSISAKNNEMFSSIKHSKRFEKDKVNRNRALCQNSLAIVSVVPCGKEECQCIMVDSDEHTYLCDDFIVTHNTVGLMVAASIWGNPALGKFVKSLNNTQNYILNQLAMLKHLPFFGDELQTIRSVEGYDKLIMKICEGVDRGRLDRNSLAQKVNDWCNVTITTGEEPCVSLNSGGGTVNRVIEIECVNKVVENGSAVSNFVKQNYGHFGRLWIEKIKEYDLMKEYRSMYDYVISDDRITEKQAMAMALLMLADCIVNDMLPNDKIEYLTVDDVLPSVKTKEEVDVTERAWEYILSVITVHDSNFIKGDSTYAFSNTVWGKYSPQRSNLLFFINTVLEELLNEKGFSLKACKEKWVAKGRIEMYGGKFTSQQRIADNRVRCVSLVINN